MASRAEVGIGATELHEHVVLVAEDVVAGRALHASVDEFQPRVDVSPDGESTPARSADFDTVGVARLDMGAWGIPATGSDRVGQIPFAVVAAQATLADRLVQDLGRRRVVVGRSRAVTGRQEVQAGVSPPVAGYACRRKVRCLRGDDPEIDRRGVVGKQEQARIMEAVTATAVFGGIVEGGSTPGAFRFRAVTRAALPIGRVVTARGGTVAIGAVREVVGVFRREGGPGREEDERDRSTDDVGSRGAHSAHGIGSFDRDLERGIEP